MELKEINGKLLKLFNALSQKEQRAVISHSHEVAEDFERKAWRTRLHVRTNLETGKLGMVKMFLVCYNHAKGTNLEYTSNIEGLDLEVERAEDGI